jgi:hypothetical protein
MPLPVHDVKIEITCFAIGTTANVISITENNPIPSVLWLSISSCDLSSGLRTDPHYTDENSCILPTIMMKAFTLKSGTHIIGRTWVFVVVTCTK